MDIIKYWICACILIILEVLSLVCNQETMAVVSIGLCWLIVMIGFGIETFRFTDYIKSRYPAEYKNMLKWHKKRRKLFPQLHYRPLIYDPELARLQMRVRHYFKFVLFAVFVPFGIVLLFMVKAWR